jgi:hypothetical protein
VEEQVRAWWLAGGAASAEAPPEEAVGVRPGEVTVRERPEAASLGPAVPVAAAARAAEAAVRVSVRARPALVAEEVRQEPALLR